MARGKSQVFEGAPVDIAIIGMGAMFPDAENLTEYWQNLLSGHDSIRDIPLSHWRPSDYHAKARDAEDMTYGSKGGFLNSYRFDPLKFGITPQAIQATDTSQLLGMVVAHEALVDAGYGPEREFDRDRVSCIVGVTGALELVVPLGARLGHPIWRRALQDAGVADDVAQDVIERIKDSYVGWQEASFPGLLGNVVAGRIANRLNLGGTNAVADAACGSSLAAVKNAVLELVTGQADMVLTGGVDTFNDIFMYMCFSKTPALSPSGHAHPYDATGDGTTLGEGIGIVVLKRLADAKRDGDRIYAVIKGIGSSSDGLGKAIYAPKSEGQAKAIQRCYTQAGIDPGSVGLIEGHGTGTKVGDGVEVDGLKIVFGSKVKPTCALGSVKSQIGHTKAAAGAAGLIKAALALYHRVLPPTIKVSEAHPALAGSPFYLNGTGRPWISNGHLRRAGVSAFGFGGSNFHCVLEEGPSEPTPMAGEVEIIPFMADSREALMNEVRGIPDGIHWGDVAAFAQAKRRQFQAGVAERRTGPRLVICAERWQRSLGEWREKALRLLEQVDTPTFLPEGMSYAPRPHEAAGQIAVVFPGQGSQYPGMLRDLVLHRPEPKAVLEAFSLLAPGLGDRIFPPVLHEGELSAFEKDLTRTECAQPAIGALSAGAYLVLQAMGLKADMLAGHSFGELTALWAAGVLTLDDFAALALERGKLMGSRASSDLGGMIAVRASRETIESMLAEHKLDLVVANHNSPTQVILSGPSEAVEEGLSFFAAHSIKVQRLPVGAAFHSRLVEHAVEPFRAAVSKVALSKPMLPVYANSTGRAYPSAASKVRAIISEQLANPVEFTKQIKAMADDGATLFIEVGPNSNMAPLIRQTLGDSATVFSLDQQKGSRGNANLAKLIGQLVCSGVSLDLEQWAPSLKVVDEPARFTMELTGANYFPSKPPKPPSRQKDTITVKESEPIQPVSPAQPKMAPETLQLLQESLIALQRLSVENARLHEKYLDGQKHTQELFGQLLNSLVGASSGAPASRPSVGIGRSEVAAGTPILSGLRAFSGEQTSPIASGQIETHPGFDRAVSRAPALEPALPPEKMPERGAGAATATITPPDYGLLNKAAVPLPASTPGAMGQDTVSKTVVRVIADKTGYPEAMIQHEMSLEADLGIDSIKRVEIMSALQEVLPEVAESHAEKLAGLDSVGAIVRFFAKVETPSVGKANDSASIPAKVLTIIAEKTGYPVSMLTLSMNLESDLGIDSIKRVEIFSQISESFAGLGAKAFSPEQSAKLHTIADVIDFVTLSEAPQPKKSLTETRPTEEQHDESLLARLIAIVAEKTGYPAAMIDPAMSLEADLGIDSIKRVEIMSAFREANPEGLDFETTDLNQAATLAEVLRLAKKTWAPEREAAPELLSAMPSGLVKKNARLPS